MGSGGAPEPAALAGASAPPAAPTIIATPWQDAFHNSRGCASGVAAEHAASLEAPGR